MSPYATEIPKELKNYEHIICVEPNDNQTSLDAFYGFMNNKRDAQLLENPVIQGNPIHSGLVCGAPSVPAPVSVFNLPTVSVLSPKVVEVEKIKEKKEEKKEEVKEESNTEIEKVINIKNIGLMMGLVGRYNEFLKESPDIAKDEELFSAFITISSAIANSPIKKSSVEYCDNESLYFTAIYNNHHIFYEYFLDSDDDDQVIIAKYQDKIKVADWGGKLKESLIVFKEFASA